MARSFTSINPKSYTGLYVPQALTLCVPPKQPPRAIKLTIDWATYAPLATTPNIGVMTGLPNAVIDQLGAVSSIYIDNTNSAVPIYVQAVDTGFTVTAPPGTSTWYPMVTNDVDFLIVGLGFSAASVGAALTTIYLSNRPMGPSSDQEFPQALGLYKTSASISRGTTLYTTNFGSAALGDQNFNFLAPASPSTYPLPLMGTPRASGFIYITSIFASLFNITDNSLADFDMEIRDLDSTPPNFDLFKWFIPTSATVTNFVGFVNYTGLQIKIDATHRWVMRGQLGTPASGFGNWNIIFSTNPQ